MKKTLAVAALLAAAAFAGAERTPSIEAVPAAEKAAPPVADTPSPALGELKVTNFSRHRGDLEVEDLFSVPAPPPPPPPAPAPAVVPKVELAVAPSAPPLPYSYLGRMTRRGHAVVYLLRNQEMVLAQAGETLDGTYLVENITLSAVQFVYLPLQARQQLTIPHSP